MRTALLILLLLCSAARARAQPTTAPAETVVQLVQPGSSQRFFLMARDSAGRKTQYYLKVQTLADGRAASYPLRGPLDAVCHRWRQNQLSIFFVNEQLGFLYGSAVGYGYCYFMYRSTDGGQSWQPVHLDAQKRLAPAFREGFYMFNARQGLALTQLLGGQLSYYLTADGGRSWTPKTLRLPGYASSTNAPEIGTLLRPFYAPGGQVLLVGTWGGDALPSGQRTSAFPVFESTDFGLTFRQLK